MTWAVLVVGILVLLFGVAAFFGAPYVPSQKKYAARALEKLYPLGKRDVLVDIGAGDGLILRLASACGARAVGYEINPLLWLIARLASRRDARVSVRLANFWRAPLPDETTVVYAFSVHRDGPRLADKLTREAARLGRPLVLICLGSPLKNLTPGATYEAYFRYTFPQGGQGKSVTV